MLFREMKESDLEEILTLDREIFRTMAYSERDFLYAISGKFDKALVLVEKEPTAFIACSVRKRS